MSNGTFAGYRVQETPGVRYLLGVHAALGYRLLRSARFLVAGVPAYLIDAAGTMSSVPTTYAVGDQVLVSTRAIVNGVQHCRLADGPYSGYWVGEFALSVT